ncbi:MAG TPA: DUF6152 family protein, partial [Gammaproteobacteria bacterium]|nr:DUF6152 family protein [Gammaproteobacteria bacterium]
MKSGINVVLVVLCSAFASGADAHHSFAAEFDPDLRGSVSGTITRVQFTNPHVRYRLDVVNADGATEEWELQMSSVTSLRGASWFRDTLVVGDEVTAEGQLGRNGTHKLFIRQLEKADGTLLSTSSGRAAETDPEDLDVRDGAAFAYGQLNDSHPFDISGPWRNSYKFRVTVDDLEPKPTPFSAEGRAVFEATDHYDDYALRCMSLGLPRLFGSPYNMEIVDAGTHYVALHVQNNLPRRIYMDGREPPENYQPTSNGFSVGHWDGDELVIETTHLLPGWLDGSGLPMSGDGTRILERWSFDERRLAMDRVMTIYDPYYTEPLVRRRGSARGFDVEIVEQASCDPD